MLIPATIYSPGNSSVPTSPWRWQLTFGLFVLWQTYGLAASPEHPLDPGDFSSPKATLQTFLSQCEVAYQLVQNPDERQVREAEVDMIRQRILRCLDLSKIPEYRQASAGREAAVHLKEVLDRIELPWERSIPKTGSWTIPHTQISIVPIEEGDRKGEYVFSSETVEHAEEFFERVQHLPYRENATEGFRDWYLSHPRQAWLAVVVRWLPDWARSRMWGQAVWQWFAMAGTVLLGVVLLFSAYRIGLIRSDETKKRSLIRYWITLAFPILAMAIPVTMKWWIEAIGVSGNTLTVVQLIADLTFLATAVVLVLAIERRITFLIVSAKDIHRRGMDAQLIRLVGRVAGIIAATFIVLEGGRHFGIPLTTLLAGAGVGGLAVALAAQDALKNLFGSLMITLDKPYKVGDRIVVKGYDGIVEDIGLRSSKVRLLTGHVVSVPNEEMARSDIENVSKRVHIRRVQDLYLSLETPAHKVQEAIQILRTLLENHEGKHEDYPPRVYFDTFNRDSLNLRFFLWFHPADYWLFLQATEQLNLRILEKFKEADIQLVQLKMINTVRSN